MYQNKIHKNDYPLTRARGDEKAFSQGKALTVVITDIKPNEVQYRLLSSANPKIYHWRYSEGSPLKPINFTIGEKVGINTINRNTKYYWLSKFEPFNDWDVFKAMVSINDETLLNLLSSEQYLYAQQLYNQLHIDFTYDQMDYVHQQFVDDFNELYDYWNEQQDPRALMLSKL